MSDSVFPYGSQALHEGGLETLGASLRLVRHQGTVREHQSCSGRHWLELALSPRAHGLTACFPDQWGPHRRERVGDLVFIPAGEAVHFRADAGVRHTGIVCEIEPSAFRHWAGREPTLPGHKAEALLDVSSSTIRHLLRRLAEEARTPGIASARLVEALFVQGAIELARYCDTAADTPMASGLAGWRLRLIDERIADFAHPPSLEELAALCGMSARQLTRAFRASRNSSIGEYQLQLRLDAAKRRLAGPESIKEIAFSLGFASPSRFAAAFRRNFAITPLQFRQRVLKTGLKVA